MAYITPQPRSDGAVIDASIWNQDIRANMLAMAPDIFTTAGDISYATAANAMTRLGIGSALMTLIANSGATAPEWGFTHGALADASAGGGGVASFDITSINQSFRHLLIMGSLQSDVNATNDYCKIQLNGVTATTNYHREQLTITNTSVGAAGVTGTDPAAGYIAAPGSSAGRHTNTKGPFVIFIPDYTEATCPRNIITLSGHASSGTVAEFVLLISVGTLNVAGAITQVTIDQTTGSNFTEGSRVTVMGLS